MIPAGPPVHYPICLKKCILIKAPILWYNDDTSNDTNGDTSGNTNTDTNDDSADNQQNTNKTPNRCVNVSNNKMMQWRHNQPETMDSKQR